MLARAICNRNITLYFFVDFYMPTTFYYYLCYLHLCVSSHKELESDVPQNKGTIKALISQPFEWHSRDLGHSFNSQNNKSFIRIIFQLQLFYIMHFEPEVYVQGLTVYEGSQFLWWRQSHPTEYLLSTKNPHSNNWLLKEWFCEKSTW